MELFKVVVETTKQGATMKRTPVESSNVKDIGHDAQERVLEVGFLNGSVYQYLDVPESIYNGLMQAESKGAYLDEHVKKAGYKYRQVS